MSDPRLTSYIRRGHRYVQGWLRPGATQAVIAFSTVQRQADVPGGVAEIGVHHGKLFILLYLLGCGDEPAVAIDLFSQQHLNFEHSGSGNLEKFKENLQRYADLNRLIIHEGDSTELSSADLIKLGRGPLRLISIDGGHTPEVTAHDLGTAEGALADGGVIILDDCFNESFPGVAEGVFRYFSTPRTIVPFAVGAGKTFFCHPPFVLRYTAALQTMRAKIARHGFLGYRVLCLEFAPPTLAERIGKIETWRKLKHLPPARMVRWLYHATRPLLNR